MGMSGKGPREMAIMTSTVNTLVYIEILGFFLVPLVENRFVDDEIIFQDNLSCHKAKHVCVFARKCGDSIHFVRGCILQSSSPNSCLYFSLFVFLISSLTDFEQVKAEEMRTI